MLGSFRSNVTVGIAVLAGIAGLSYVLAASAAPPGGTTAAVEFTPDGKLKRPVGYRNWVYVGEVVTPNDMNDGEATFPEFHSVYMDPESFAEYEKTGKYRDGTVLIKELSSVGTKKAPSGNGYFQGEFTGLEATIKDSSVIIPNQVSESSGGPIYRPCGAIIRASLRVSTSGESSERTISGLPNT